MAIFFLTLIPDGTLTVFFELLGLLELLLLTFFSMFLILFSAFLTFSANFPIVVFVFFNSDRRFTVRLLVIGERFSFDLLLMIIFLCLNNLDLLGVAPVCEFSGSALDTDLEGDNAESKLFGSV